MLSKPIKTNEKLIAALRDAKARVDAMPPDEYAIMVAKQRASYVLAEMSWPKPKFKWVNGAKVYETYEDYVND